MHIIHTGLSCFIAWLFKKCIHFIQDSVVLSPDYSKSAYISYRTQFFIAWLFKKCIHFIQDSVVLSPDYSKSAYISYRTQFFIAWLFKTCIHFIQDSVFYRRTIQNMDTFHTGLCFLSPDHSKHAYISYRTLLSIAALFKTYIHFIQDSVFYRRTIQNVHTFHTGLCFLSPDYSKRTYISYRTLLSIAALFKTYIYFIQDSVFYRRTIQNVHKFHTGLCSLSPDYSKRHTVC